MKLTLFGKKILYDDCAVLLMCIFVEKKITNNKACLKPPDELTMNDYWSKTHSHVNGIERLYSIIIHMFCIPKFFFLAFPNVKILFYFLHVFATKLHMHTVAHGTLYTVIIYFQTSTKQILFQ